MVGTLVTSAIALIIGVQVADRRLRCTLTEMCPRKARAPLGMLVDLLAAVPSVVYGLWGVFVLGPKLLPVEKWFANTFSFIPFIGGGGSSITAPNYFIAGLILAIMILHRSCRRSPARCWPPCLWRTRRRRWRWERRGGR